MGILSLLGRHATNSVAIGRNANSRRMFFTGVQAFQREVIFVGHRTSMGAALSFNLALQLAASSSEEGGSKVLTNQDLVERRLEGTFQKWNDNRGNVRLETLDDFGSNNNGRRRRGDGEIVVVGW